MTFQHSLSLNIQDRPLVRGYVHSSYQASAVPVADHFHSSLTWLLQQNDTDFPIDSPYDPASWFVGILWQDRENKLIDFFRFSNYEGWPGNPEVASYVVLNAEGILGGLITCTEGLLLLGEEELLRRGTKSLDEYLKASLDLGFVNRKISGI